MEIFQKVWNLVKNFQTNDEYVILAETIPAGTTTANATALALGYECEDIFSSSFKNNPSDIKNETIKKLLKILI